MQSKVGMAITEKRVRVTSSLSNTGVAGVAAGTGAVIVAEEVIVDSKLASNSSATVKQHNKDAAVFEKNKCSLVKLMRKTKLTMPSKTKI